MKRMFSIMVFLCLIFAGCTQQEQSVEEREEITSPDAGGDETKEVEEPTSEVDGIIEAPSGIAEPDEPVTGRIATTQEECATMTPNCESCVLVEGCGWCKESQSCFLGTEEGPSVSSCKESEWAYDETACRGPIDGEGCAEQTNCADCLSGSGCKWCIQGSLCVDESSEEDCFGSWLTTSYQCNFASR